MVHKLTALIQLPLMAVVVATSQPGLNYCPCLEELCVGSCECSKEPSPNASCSTSCDSDSCSDIEIAEANIPECSSSDCLVSILFETEDFVNFVHEVRPTGDDGGQSSSFPSASDLTLRTVSLCRQRGPPRTVAFPYSVPLFIRHSVFLI